MKIKRYNPERAKAGESVFYIQSHGLHAGRPLKKPIPNSWEVETENPQAYALCFMVYTSRILEIYIRGSVIPFIALEEYKKIITPILANPAQENEDVKKKIDTIYKIDAELENIEKKTKLYKQLKTAISYELLKTLNAQ